MVPPMMNSNVRSSESSNKNMLSLPTDTEMNTSTQASLDQFKEELKGLTRHVFELTSKMSSSTCAKDSEKDKIVDQSSPPESSQRRVPLTVTTEVVPPSSSSNRPAGSVPVRQTETRQISMVTGMEEEEISSESGDESSEGESSSEEESDVESENTAPSLRTADGLLDWISLVQLIVDQFPDKIGPEEDFSSTNERICNLGGMVEKKGGQGTFTHVPSNQKGSF